MKIISLSSNIAGPACAIATSIKKYFYNGIKETDMFDYLEISLVSIVQILKLNEGDIHNLSDNNTFIPNINNCQSVTFNNFDRIISHHDLKNDYNIQDYINFIDKYKRRYYRLMETIKRENKIFFIRYGEENANEFIEFINIIKTINPLCDFFIINLIYDMENKEIITDIPNLYVINFYHFLDSNVCYNDDLYYRTIQLNWRIVYNLIYNNLDDSDKNKISFSN